jgi:hypothetical protein
MTLVVLLNSIWKLENICVFIKSKNILRGAYVCRAAMQVTYVCHVELEGGDQMSNGRDEGLTGLWKGRSGKRNWGEGMQVPREVEEEEEMGIGGPEVFSYIVGYDMTCADVATCLCGMLFFY